MSASRRLAAISVPLFMLSGCSGSVATPLAKPPSWDTPLAKCSVAKSQSDPLVVEWPSAERARLEALAREGLVAVRYTGCEIRVLGSCRAPGRYQYVGTTVKHDRESIRNADELFAKLPLGAARLEGTLQKSGQLDVAMTIVGRYRADKLQVHANELQGDCQGATHFVSALTAGAFEFGAGADASAGARAGAFGGEAGGSSRASRSILTSDGLESSCENAKLGDDAPPPGCAALLRIEVVSFPELAEQEHQKAIEVETKDKQEREGASSRRSTGWWLTGGGVLALAGAGTFAFLHYNQERKLERGGFATGADIADAQSTSSTFNALGIVFGIGGAVLSGIGIPLILANPDPPAPASASAKVRVVGSSLGLGVEWP